MHQPDDGQLLAQEPVRGQLEISAATCGVRRRRLDRSDSVVASVVAIDPSPPLDPPADPDPRIEDV